MFIPIVVASQSCSFSNHNEYSYYSEYSHCAHSYYYNNNFDSMFYMSIYQHFEKTLSSYAKYTCSESRFNFKNI